MASTPLLVVTDDGLAAASVASPVGPFIEITSFAVGSGFGYEVQSTHNTLNGDLLYQGALASYASVGDNTIAITCRIPPDAGPFDFGEVALYLADGTMFAKAAFDTPQTKYSSLGTNLALTYTFVCLLKLDQSVASFKIVTNDDSANSVLQLRNWSELVPPGLSADPNVQLAIIKEVDDKGQGTLVIQSSETRWTPASTYYPLGKFVLSNAAATWVQIPIEAWPYINDDDSMSYIETGSLLVETSDGFFRSVAAVQHVGNPVSSVKFLLNPEPLLNIPVIGASVTIHTNSMMRGESVDVTSFVTVPNMEAAIRLALTSQVLNAYTTTGSLGNFLISPVSAPSAYASNLRYALTFNGVGGNNPTLTVGALDALPIMQYSLAGTLVPATIVMDMKSDVVCNSTHFILLNPLPSPVPAEYRTPVGAGMDYFGAYAPAGWVFANGATIGNVGSGATGRAAADCLALFVHLWESFSNTALPVSGGRGASAMADWAAGKTIAVPDKRSRVTIGTDTMGGLIANRFVAATLGATGGEASHVLTVQELPAHTHGLGVGFGSGGSMGRIDYDPATSATSESTGSGEAHNNMQPYLACSYIIKL